MMKIHQIIFNIDYDVRCHHAKFQIKIQLVYGEDKNDKLHYGVS
jgi:hypothetical protein